MLRPMLVSCYLFIIQGSLCRLSSYIHVPTVAKSSGVPILVSANEPPGTLASLICTQCSAAEFYHFLQCSENSLVCSAVQTPGTEGIIFSSGEERTEAAGCSREAELHSHQHQREREGKKRGRLLCPK